MNDQTHWRVFSVIYRPTPLLPHFVRHYAALGFTDIILAASELCHDIDWQLIRANAGSASVHVNPLYGGVFDNARDTAILNGLKARYVEDRYEWSAQADIDEFYEYPLPLTQLAMLAKDVNCILGWFVDRIATDGSLPQIRDDVPISEQFPVETHLTRRILGGCDRKLILTRGFQPINQGHHGMPGERPYPRHGRVLHYKWNAGVLAHLGERLATCKETGYAWGHECERFFDYWRKKGRIFFDDCR